jgi:hypothetical protein
MEFVTSKQEETAELFWQKSLLSSDREVSPAHTIVSGVSSYLAAAELTVIRYSIIY